MTRPSLGEILERAHVGEAVEARTFDMRLFQAAEHPDPRGAALYRAAAAAEILTWRRQVLTDLTRKGVLCIDAFPSEMTAPLVNKYLDVKARHLL